MKIIADFRNISQKRLFFYMNDKLIKMRDKDYTMEIDNERFGTDILWYPCVTLYDGTSACSIEFVE